MINDFKKNQTFEQGAFLLLVSGVLVKIIGAFFKIPLSSDYCLGNMGFGYFSSVYDIYLPVYTLTSSGIPSSISRIISEYLVSKDYNNANKAFMYFKKLMMVVGIIGTVLLLVFSFPFVRLTDKTGKTLLTFLAMCPAILFCFLSSVYRGFFEGNRNMLPTAFSNLIDALSKLLLGFTSAFIVVKLTDNTALAATATMAGITLGSIISFVFLKIFYSKVYKDDNRGYVVLKEDSVLLKRMLSISLPIILSSFAISIITFIDSITVRWSLSEIPFNESKVYLGELFNADLSLNNETLPTVLYGIKSKAYTIFNLIIVIPALIATGALPSITAQYIKKDNDGIKKTVDFAIKLSSTIAFPIAFGLIFVSSPIMKLLYNDSFNISGNILSIYGFAALFAGIITVLTSILQATDKQNAALNNFVIGLIIKVISNVVLVSIPRINILGAAISTLLCFGYIVIAHFVVMIFGSHISPDFKGSIFKPFLSGLICGITALLFCKISDFSYITILGILVAAVIYIVFLVIFRAFTMTEIKSFFAKKH